MRHNEAILRTFALGIGPGVLSPPQPAGFAALVTTRTGALTVRSRDVATTVTPEYCAWIEHGDAYALAFRSRCDVRIVLARTDGPRPASAGALVMTPLLREAIERAVTVGYLDPANQRHAHVSAVIADELTGLKAAPAALSIGLPCDPMLHASIERCLAAGDDLPSIADLALAANVSLRTFERHFVTETGLTPREWLRRLRLARAAIALATGATVTEAGFASGYTSTSAFITAYRAYYGKTPGVSLVRMR